MRKHFGKLGVVVLAVLAASAFAFAQRGDLAGNLDGDVSLAPATRINSASTGAWIDIANYTSVAMTVHTGQVDAAVYVVLQDSSAGLAVRAVDSVQIAATADTAYLDLGYRESRRFVRALQRATGGAADSVFSSAAFIGTRRAR